MSVLYRKISLVLATFLAFSAIVFPAFAEQNFVVFDFNAAVAQSKAGKSMGSQLESQMKVVTDEAQKFDESLAGELKNFRNNVP